MRIHRPGDIFHISKKRDSVLLGYPNTQKRIENTMCSGAFLTKLEVFG